MQRVVELGLRQHFGVAKVIVRTEAKKTNEYK